MLASIFAAGPLSRPQIAARTGLSKVTVGAAVERLTRAGLVQVSGPVHGARGRSPLTYGLAGRAGYVIGIDLDANCARAAASDIVGELIAEVAQPAARQTPRALSAQVLALVSALIERAGPDRGQLLAIGVSVPGVVDQNSRRVTALAHNLSADGGLDPLSALRGRFDVPVLIDNDVNLAGLGELWHGAGRGQHTFALVSVGVGVGMGIVIDGALVRARTEPPARSAIYPAGSIPSPSVIASTAVSRTTWARLDCWPRLPSCAPTARLYRRQLTLGRFSTSPAAATRRRGQWWRRPRGASAPRSPASSPYSTPSSSCSAARSAPTRGSSRQSARRSRSSSRWRRGSSPARSASARRCAERLRSRCAHARAELFAR